MNDNLSKRKPFLPKDTALPFFAYGQFKSNQIAYERLAPYVEEIEYATMDGCFLAVRDALPLLGTQEQMKVAPPDFKIYGNQVHGEVITFKSSDAQKAYQAIEDLEPSNVYRWSVKKVNSVNVNVLTGYRIFKGSQSLDSESWSMEWHDPFIGDLEKMIDRLLNDEQRKYQVIELQAAYMMLWAGIERLIALKYSIKNRNEEQIRAYLANNNEIADLFSEAVVKPDEFRDIHGNKDPETDKRTFVPGNPDQCLQYLREIRHNVVHRGKGGFADTSLTLKALEFSREIFQKLYQF